MVQNDAAQKIWSHWQNGTRFDAFDTRVAPINIDQGYAIQEQLSQIVAEPVVGWKIAGTAEAGRRHINVETPLAGRLFSSKVYANEDKVPFAGNAMAVAEAEIVLCMGHDLPPQREDYSREDVIKAVETVRVGLEFPDSRFEEFTRIGAPGLIADNACARDFVLGDVVEASWTPETLHKIPTALYVNDKKVTDGIGADALGGPIDALVWLASTLNRLGITLKAGQIVTTGVTGAPSPVRAGDEVHAVAGGVSRASTFLI